MKIWLFSKWQKSSNQYRMSTPCDIKTTHTVTSDHSTHSTEFKTHARIANMRTFYHKTDSATNLRTWWSQICTESQITRASGSYRWCLGNSNCSRWSFKVAVLPINPNMYADQCDCIISPCKLTGCYTIMQAKLLTSWLQPLWSRFHFSTWHDQLSKILTNNHTLITPLTPGWCFYPP